MTTSVLQSEAHFNDFCAHTPGISTITGPGFIVGTIRADNGELDLGDLADLRRVAGPCFDDDADGVRFRGQISHGARVAYLITTMATDHADGSVNVNVRISNATMALGINLVTARDERGQHTFHVWPWMTTDIDTEATEVAL